MKILRALILTVSLVFILTGLIFGDLYNGIFIKAINICLECIGIG